MFDIKRMVKPVFGVFGLVSILATITLAAAASTVSVSHGRLSVKAEDASLTGIFQEIASQAGFELLAQLEPDIQVSANFKDLDLAEGIKKLHKNTIIIYRDSRIVQVVLGTDQSSSLVDDLSRFFLKVFPGLKSEARILEAMKDSDAYPLLSAALSDILNSPGSWREVLIRLSQQVTPQIREELFERINPQLAVYAEEQGILAGVSPDNYNPLRILVRFLDTVTQEDIEALERLTGSEVERQFIQISSYLYQLSVPDDLDVASLLAIYNNHPLVKYAEADYKQYIIKAPEPPDEFYSLQYAHQLTSAESAWDQTTGSSGVVIAVIDTGVDFAHQDLAANMWVNSGEIPANGVDDDGNGYVDDYYGINAISGSGSPLDDHGHGTHVAGIIGAVGNNGVGVAGVNWTCKIMALKFLSAGGSGSTSDAIACIDYAVAMGAHVTNNSWGGGGAEQSLKDAISKLNDHRITFVVAAGNYAANNDSEDFYPANYNVENVISVAATTEQDTLADFSNYGALAVDVAAPGEDIYSTSLSNTYADMSGTSMAAPYVAGIIGLMIAKNPTIVLNPSAIRQALIDSCDKLPSLAGRVVSGGRVNVNNALNTSLMGPILSPAEEFADDLESNKHDDCFIATASYGSSRVLPVRILRRFRDRYLLTNSWGREFVEFYYENSPPLARYISDKPVWKFAVRILLWPVVFLSWFLLQAGPGVGMLMMAGFIGIIFRAKFFNRGMICLLFIGCLFMTSPPVYAQDPTGNDSETLKEPPEDFEEYETVEKLTDVLGKIGVRLRFGHANDRSSSSDFFKNDDVEFGVDSSLFYEGEVFYPIPIRLFDFIDLGGGLSAAYLKRDLEVGVTGVFPSEDFGTITTFPILANLEGRFVLKETVAVFLRLGLGYSFNHFSKGDWFDDLAQEQDRNYYTYENKAKADHSFAYRIGAGFEYFVSKRFSAALVVDYLGLRPKIKVTEKNIDTGAETISNPKISLNSVVLSLGVTWYFDLDSGAGSVGEP